MGAPATQGRLCTKLEEMQIGDYIKCEYLADTANVAGVFFNLGTSISEVELPIIAPTTIPNGYFYFLKVDKGLLIADRMIQDQISWTSLNDKNYVFGKKTYRIPSLAEYKKYIADGDLNGNIIKQDINVWHKPTKPTERQFPYYKGRYYDTVSYHTFNDNAVLLTNCEWIQDNSTDKAKAVFRIDLATYNSVYQAYESYYNSFLPCYISKALSTSDRYAYTPSNRTILEAAFAFRPVLEYIDNKKSKTFWY